MVENAGRRLLARATVIRRRSGQNIHVTDDNITQCMHEIRDALGSESRHLLRTVRRRGYIFDAGVVRRQSDSSGQVGAVNEAGRSPGVTACVGSSISPAIPLSVLVLPLRGRHGSDAHERFSAHITADILTDLVRYLRILAPGEAQVLFQDERSAYRQATPGECQADYLLRGTVQGMRRASVNLQLIHRASEVCIWADRFEPGDPSGRTARLMHEISATLLRDVERRLDAVVLNTGSNGA